MSPLWRRCFHPLAKEASDRSVCAKGMLHEAIPPCKGGSGAGRGVILTEKPPDRHMATVQGTALVGGPLLGR